MINYKFSQHLSVNLFLDKFNDKRLVFKVIDLHNGNIPSSLIWLFFKSKTFIFDEFSYNASPKC